MTHQIFSLSSNNRIHEQGPVLEDATPEEQAINFRENFSKYIYRWPLFLLGVLIALSIAVLYLKSVVPVYDIKAKLLINDENRMPTKEAALKELDLFQGSKVVENEIEILKSRKLLVQVINDLQLSVEYKLINEKLKIDLYGQSPIHFSFSESSGTNVNQGSFTIFIKNKDKFVLIGNNEENLEASFNQHITNNLGKWKIEATEEIKKFIGERIEITVFNPSEIADYYANKLNIQVSNKQTSVIELSIQDVLPKRGEEILNKLIELYTYYSRDEKNLIAKSTLNFIDDRLATLTGELNQAEKNVEGYQSSQGLTDISSESKVFLGNVQTNDNNLNEVNVQLNVLAGIEQYVNSPSNTGNAPATIGITDPTLIELVNQLMELQMQREKLLAITPEANPVFEPINRQIRITKASLKENIQGIKSNLLTTRKQLQAYNSRFESSIKKLPGQERLLVNVKRQQSIKENLYVYLLQKREEVSFGYASDLSESPTIDPAFIGKPTVPNTYRVLFIALLLGLAFPAALIYGKEIINNQVTSPREIKMATSIPVLSELIFEESSHPFIKDNSNNSILGEQFRTLRTYLKHLHGGIQKGRVTLLTSSIPNEGKSFVTTNLGITLATSGRKTIILELDLRKPKISKNLNLNSEHPGLTTYLQGKASIEEIVQSSGIHPNLLIISAGPTSAFASELLEQPSMDVLINYLRIVFDDILFDTPPVHLVTDALILTRFSTVSLYMIRQAYTPTSELSFIKELFKEQKLPGINLIFNGIQNKGRYSYGYDYTSYSEYFDTESSKISDSRLSIKNFLSRFKL